MMIHNINNDPDGYYNGCSEEKSYLDDSFSGDIEPTFVSRREIVCSSTKKRSFDRIDSWQADRYKDMVCVNLFDQKIRRPLSFRSQEGQSNDDFLTFNNSCKSSSSEDKMDCRVGIVPSISLLFSSFSSNDSHIANDADWIDLYPNAAMDILEVENPEKPQQLRKRNGSSNTKTAEEICKIFNITSASVFDGGM